VLDQNDDAHWMRLALDQAGLALDAGEVPVGCVIVHQDRVIGRGWNRTEGAGDPTAHAEILAISAAAATLGHSRLTGATVYVTLEPCLMCAGALLLARVEQIVFGAPEPKFGALGSRLDVTQVQGFNHRYSVRSGVLAAEAAGLMREFFREKRVGGTPPRDPDV
jgi:tRNA(adenine34) deaminase